MANCIHVNRVTEQLTYNGFSDWKTTLYLQVSFTISFLTPEGYLTTHILIQEFITFKLEIEKGFLLDFRRRYSVITGKLLLEVYTLLFFDNQILTSVLHVF